MLKELVEYLAKNLVENPDAVSVEAIEDEKMSDADPASRDRGQIWATDEFGDC